ncbi:hypothetical protein DPX39_030035000 [Trypanosoma brucei equiperdum]|uniref:Uncharacterized protein n=1 Tax=Trypanosoma brucei equiperdum TaxID=630700 RepID=A0A3L6LC50_9TRYP|nr:hypothetical protein DPX39_030035000 [Trypanosoma brucei equiperdum]
MSHSAFLHNRLWRKQAGGLTIKSFNRFDDLGPLTVPVSPPTSDLSDAGITVRRSAYSVLRMRNSQPGVCAQNLLSCSGKSIEPEMHKCCCSALLYRSPHRGEASTTLSSDEELERDDFVFSLKLAEVEQMLQELVGVVRYEELVGPALADARWIGMCQSMPEAVEGAGGWIARVLLTPEEEHRIKWLREDGVQLSDKLACIPSFKALYVAFHTVGGEGLGLSHFEVIEKRMREGSVKWDMSDAAVACFFAMHRVESRPFCCHVVRDVLLETGSQGGMVAATAPEPTLRHVLGATLLLRMVGVLLLEAQGTSGAGLDPPMYLFAAITEFLAFVKSLPVGRFTCVLREIAVECRARVASLASFYTVPVGSSCLPDFTLWLLREVPNSASCHLHFRHMTLRSHTEAITLLEKSFLLSPQCLDLHVVVDVLFPLLDSSEVDDFYFIVFNEVLTRLGERLHRNVQSFTEDDFRLITALGVRLFEGQGSGLGQSSSQTAGNCPFDAKKLEQLEQLQVMGGSPWSFIVLSYDYLKEVMRSLVRDGRQSKYQRQYGRSPISSVAEAAALGGGGGIQRKSLFPKAVERGKNNIPCIITTTGTECPDASEGGLESDGAMTFRKGYPLLSPSSLTSLRERFVVFVEELVKTLVDERGIHHRSSSVVSDDLFTFVSKHMSLPNIHDEYRRKIYLLVNIMTKETSTRIGDEGRSIATSEDDIPPELRYLVTSLSLMLSPWAAVMILRDVLSESSGMNPRYTYVLNAAIDLQLPTSTTRSRMATTLNMWRFISSQSRKMTFAEHMAMKRRCAVNIPLSYILSSYWSLLTWLTLLTIVGLNVAGLDLESQYAATRLFRDFAPPEDVIVPLADESCLNTVHGAVSSYFEGSGLNGAKGLTGKSGRREVTWDRISQEGLFSSAPYIFSRAADRRLPMTVVSVGSEGSVSAVDQVSREFACASTFLHELAGRSIFPFYLSIDQMLSADLIVARVAERIRRVSFDNAWFVSRAVFRTFPLGRAHTEHSLVTHTCDQASSKRRRITFLLYVQRNIPIPPQLLLRLSDSVLAQHGDLVLVTHDVSLKVGGCTPKVLEQLAEAHRIRCIPCAPTGGVDGGESMCLSRFWELWAHGNELTRRCGAFAKLLWSADHVVCSSRHLRNPSAAALHPTKRVLTDFRCYSL